MCRHLGMQNAVGRVFHDDKDIEQAKGRRDDAEVARNDGLGMIAAKRSVPVTEAPYRLCLEGRTQAIPRSPTYGRNCSPRSHLTDAGERLC